VPPTFAFLPSPPSATLLVVDRISEFRQLTVFRFQLSQQNYDLFLKRSLL
jgi:hypothetical protein